MEKTITTMVQINTSSILLDTYELLALDVTRMSYEKDWTDEENPTLVPLMSHDNIGKNLTLINLNAAIIEGTLRTLFSDILHKDSVEVGELAIEKKDNPNYQQVARTYGLIKRLRDEVELKGGWENIKRQYSEYVGLELDKLGSNEMKSAIDTIFVIRNAAAHGTAFTMPKERMEVEQKDMYPYKWQNKLHGMNVYVKKEFDLSFFDALRSPEFAKHFMEITQKFFALVSEAEVFPEESKFHFANLESFTFGKNTSAHRKYRKKNSEPKQ
ncbi:hypothetical protein R7E46_22625 [Vibrio sp. Vb2704]|uniref:hypothetical protein n=1 Tax=Vibrio TaxID=662 RepID=UPI00215E11FF|nr:MULTISPECIES: hypothetical protein [Vibrio]MCS0161061.1 hypothetical protein [Vibrio alginolyticus]MCS0208843.1 hypothetical protein [Vibrio alginolyticus]MCS0217502.1 hypothetical protein [Vibrio alginolyticus]MDW1626352.1 hypothetical protein [Vibrio sp. Vb2704]MDW1746592.1 hypothetical protein [Vibrio sp. Vb2531]